MYASSALVLVLLPGLLVAQSIGNAKVRRGIDCSFATGANPGDSCDIFADSWGISVEQLKSLNPDLDCGSFDGSKEYCVLGVVKDDEPSKTSTTSTVVESTPSSIKTIQPSSMTTSANSHEPTQPGLIESCDKFYKTIDGDSCGDIVSKSGISREQFSKWNPSINDKCSNLWLDYYVCVHVPGAETTVPGPKPTVDGQFPTQSGIAKSCDKITHEQFRKWNPAFDANCSNLWLDYYVCVHVPGAASTHGPQPQMPNLDAKCSEYHKVGHDEGCYKIAKDAGITLDQCYMWNPTVDSKYGNLWAGYYVCVGI